MYSVLFKSTYINTPVQNESISGIRAVPTMPSNARSSCRTHEMGGAQWQLGPIERCGVDVGHWDVAPMGWEVEAQQPLACCAGIGSSLDGSWGMVGHGGCGIQGVAPMRWEGASVGRRAHSMQGGRGGHVRWR